MFSDTHIFENRKVFKEFGVIFFSYLCGLIVNMLLADFEAFVDKI